MKHCGFNSLWISRYFGEADGWNTRMKIWTGHDRLFILPVLCKQHRPKFGLWLRLTLGYDRYAEGTRVETVLGHTQIGSLWRERASNRGWRLFFREQAYMSSCRLDAICLQYPEDPQMRALRDLKIIDGMCKWMHANRTWRFWFNLSNLT